MHERLIQFSWTLTTVSFVASIKTYGISIAVIATRNTVAIVALELRTNIANCNTVEQFFVISHLCCINLSCTASFISYKSTTPMIPPLSLTRDYRDNLSSLWAKFPLWVIFQGLNINSRFSNPNRHTLAWDRVFWAIARENPSRGLTCRRVTKKKVYIYK